MATIVEVAALAGVSTATVSRVFNGQTVSDERTQAVHRAAAELNFVPNRMARSLRRQQSEIIALVIPDVSNPYFTDVARGVEDVARAAGYSVVLCNTDGDRVAEAEYLRVAASSRMAGVILAAADDDAASRVAAYGLPVVAVDRGVDGAVDEIVMDNREAGELAASALPTVEGAVCITGPAAVATARDRATGARGAGVPEVVYASFGVDEARRAALALLDRATPPSGIVAGNNLIGVGVLQALASRGLSVADLPVTVIGALPFTTLDPRAVPIVRLPSRRMGELSAERLLARILGGESGDAGDVRRTVLHGRLEPGS